MTRFVRFSSLLSLCLYFPLGFAQKVVVRLSEPVDSNTTQPGQLFHGTVAVATKFNSGLPIPAGAIATLELIDSHSDVRDKDLMLDSLQFNGQTVFVSQENIGVVVTESGEDIPFREAIEMANKGITATGPHLTLPVGTSIRYGAYIDRGRPSVPSRSASANAQSSQPTYAGASASPPSSTGTGDPHITNGPTRDPATFDIVGVHLYMTWDAALAQLEKHYGLHPVTTPPTGGIYYSGAACYDQTSNIPGTAGAPTLYIEPHKTITYCSTGHLLQVHFVEAVMRAGKVGPSIVGAVNYMVFMHGDGANFTGGDYKAFYDAVFEKYGPATSTMFNLGSIIGATGNKHPPIFHTYMWDQSRLTTPAKPLPYPDPQTDGTPSPIQMTFQPNPGGNTFPQSSFNMRLDLADTTLQQRRDRSQTGGRSKSPDM